MNAESLPPFFSVSRDLFYLSAFLFGLGIGCFLHTLRRRTTVRFKNRMLTLMFFIFSPVVIALAFTCVYSRFRIFQIFPCLITAGVLVVVSALALRFPRCVAFPLIILGGIFSIWIAYTFLRFPRMDRENFPLVSVYNGGGDIFVHFEPRGTDKFSPDTADLGPLEKDAPLEIWLALISMDPVLPLIGAQKRGFVSLVQKGGETLFTEKRLDAGLFRKWYALLSDGAPAGVVDVSLDFKEIQIETSGLAPDMNFTVSFDGEKLLFKPAW
ncbi:MAG: hypothetical protein LBP76_01745 [Treponema sp.]|jgi:hypothetical protein|nr:hypothetical protein [Treponema sp.]